MRCTLKNTLLFAAVVGIALPASNLLAGTRGKASVSATSYHPTQTSHLQPVGSPTGNAGGNLQPPTTGTGTSGGTVKQPPSTGTGGGVLLPPGLSGTNVGITHKPPGQILPPVTNLPVSNPPVSNPPTTPPTMPPTCPPKCPPTCPTKGGNHGKCGSMGMGFGFGGGSSDGSESSAEEETVVAEQPEIATAAQVVVEAESLPQVSVGATITLHGQGFGQQAGRIAIKAGGLLLATQVVKWDDNAARIVLPQVGLAGSAKATFLVLRADGSTASEIPFELVAAAQSSITQE